MISIDEELVERLYRRANGARWRAPRDLFGQALQASASRACSGASRASVDAREVERHLSSLHLEDLALACACAAGDDAAWEHFVREYRPLLYRAADAIDPSGGARDLADALYADLFGLRHEGGDRRSLFRYFHGRSSLLTWLRAVLAQRHVDRQRTSRKLDALPGDDAPDAIAAPALSPDPDRERYVELTRIVLGRVVTRLAPQDRLRLACYYGQQLTLAQTGALLGEHEATASRGLARTRREIRSAVEAELRGKNGLTDAEISRCFECVTEDAGPLDLREMLDMTSELPARKKSAPDRSNREGDRGDH
ncbi:MAG TPA: sigma-70 family RNA polymerase sigma factor [Vicinamibacterales bacterium]|nr:sigma-70 family RNA polymerase sigma factor [Vicinamibacterales bacterium]